MKRVAVSKVRIPRSQRIDGLVALLEDVVGGLQQLVERRAQPALEQDGLAELARDLEQRVVLHVARADLHDVGVLGDRLGVLGVEQLGDDRQAGLRARLGEDLERLAAQALERERRRARLEGAAAQHRGAGGLRPRARPRASARATRPCTARRPGRRCRRRRPGARRCRARSGPRGRARSRRACRAARSARRGRRRSCPPGPSSATPSGSPIAPIAVVSSPGITTTCTPVVSRRARTAATSASVAWGVITIITAARTLLAAPRRHLDPRATNRSKRRDRLGGTPAARARGRARRARRSRCGGRARGARCA